MDKVKIGEKEYTEDELKELVSKGTDYTTKTQELADAKRGLDERAQYVKDLEGVNTYAEQHPEFKQRLANLIQEENDVVSGKQRVINNENPNNYPSEGFDNNRAQVNEEDEYVSKKDLETILARKEQIDNAKRSQQNAGRRVAGEFDSLKKLGYTKEELVKIGNRAKAENRFPYEIAERMAYIGDVPDRIKEKDKPSEDEEAVKLKLLKGSSGSGYNIVEPEKELIKYGGDPGAMLRAKIVENPGLITKKE